MSAMSKKIYENFQKKEPEEAVLKDEAAEAAATAEEEERGHAALQHADRDELLQKLTEAEQQADEFKDRFLRTQAEVANASRRAERDVAAAHKYALERFVTELLPVIDSLERAVQAAQESPADTKAILDGVSLTLKMFQTALNKFGVEQVDPFNQAFNPSFHEAVSMQPSPDHQPGMVINVLQKGYLLNERLVRPAMVVVAQ